MPDLEATYQSATAKGGAPASRSMSGLTDWCATRGAGTLTDATALAGFVNSHGGAGSASYLSAGTYSFVVPFAATLTIELWSGSGGGAGGDGSNGGTGGNSVFYSVSATGGGGGQRVNGPGGAGGSGSNGDINLSGGNGAYGVYGPSVGGAGGAAPSGGYGAGGNGGEFTFCDSKGCTPGNAGGGGGGAGYVKKTFGSGVLTPGSTITLTVGAAGAAGAGTGYGYDAGFAGVSGKALISWA